MSAYATMQTTWGLRAYNSLLPKAPIIFSTFTAHTQIQQSGVGVCGGLGGGGGRGGRYAADWQLLRRPN